MTSLRLLAAPGAVALTALAPLSPIALAVSESAASPLGAGGGAVRPALRPAAAEKGRAGPGRQIAETRPRPRVRPQPRPRMRRRTTPHLRRRAPLSYLPVCSAGFSVLRPRGWSAGGDYYCVRDGGFVCAPPYAKDTHGVASTGGDGEYYAYYRCARQHPANHIGAVKCASGFSQSPPNAHPATHATYLCRMQGLEPRCAKDKHYASLKKVPVGWVYACR